ncbi:MAG: Rieske 2Fe-2S domain-containing protein [Candidatus Sungbacteria bacterium]|nr:Rieske 2Fe-2S domain-containing protein [Candidatus Sungbacteria bacterium]
MLDPRDYYIDENITEALALHPSTFHNPEFLQKELDTIFSHSWLFVPQRAEKEMKKDPRPLAEVLQEAGSYFEFTLFDSEPLFLQIDTDGFAHCFPNCCPHDNFPLRTDKCGTSKFIKCKQHGRIFSCAGKFIAHPGFDASNGKQITKGAGSNLKELPLTRWGPFFFIALGEPFAKLQHMPTYPLSSIPDNRVPIGNEEEVVDGNWKQHVRNYLDYFHIAEIHAKSFAKVVDINSYRTECNPHSVLQWAYARNPAHGFDPHELPRRFQDPNHPEKRVYALWDFIPPNFASNRYPWGYSINVWMPIKNNPAQTRLYRYHYVTDAEKYKKKDEIWKDEDVNQEDIDAMREAWRGAKSRFASRGTFSPEKEQATHWFHHWVYEMMFEKY